MALRMNQREKLPSRARNALSRGAQNASPAEQAEIKRKVKAKFPSIAVGGKQERGGERGGRRMVTVPASRAAARERRR